MYELKNVRYCRGQTSIPTHSSRSAHDTNDDIMSYPAEPTICSSTVSRIQYYNEGVLTSGLETNTLEISLTFHVVISTKWMRG